MSQAIPNQLPPVTLDEAQQQRLRKLYAEIRCLVCQNQSLADSAADLAVDLRHEVQSQIAKGSSDEQIKRWLVERYGDFVLYKPQMQASTAILWAGPFVSLALGGLIWKLVQRRRSINRVPNSALSAASELSVGGNLRGASAAGTAASSADRSKPEGFGHRVSQASEVSNAERANQLRRAKQLLLSDDDQRGS
jgi:cytochrome c-type biogenesis protein CcmH